MVPIPSRPAVSSARPVHAQLAMILQGRIIAGVYPPGSRLESEDRLAQRFGISRSTVRQALSELFRMGLVVSRKGSGSYVASSLPEDTVFGPSAAPSFTGYLEDLYLEGEWTTDADRERKELACPKAIAALLGCETRDSVVRYRRTRLFGDTRYGVAEDFLLLKVAKLVDAVDPETEPSIIHALASAGTVPTESFQRLSPCKADKHVARTLGLNIGDPLIRVSGLTTGPSGEPLDAYRLYLHPEYEVQLRFTSTGAFSTLLEDLG